MIKSIFILQYCVCIKLDSLFVLFIMCYIFIMKKKVYCKQNERGETKLPVEFSKTGFKGLFIKN